MQKHAKANSYSLIIKHIKIKVCLVLTAVANICNKNSLISPQTTNPRLTGHIYWLETKNSVRYLICSIAASQDANIL